MIGLRSGPLQYGSGSNNSAYFRAFRDRRVAEIVTNNEEILHDIDTSVQISDLPCRASNIHDAGTYGWSPTLKTIAAGVHDQGSNLSKLRGMEDQIIRTMLSFVGSGAKHVTLTIPATRIGISTLGDVIRYNEGRGSGRNHPLPYDRIARAEKSSGLGKTVAFASCGLVEFPEPQDINVNMMPFIIGDRISLPPHLRPYYDNIIACCPYDKELDEGKVGYITVQESMVKVGKSQRRGGLHIDSPGVFEDRTDNADMFYQAREHHWGMGTMFEHDRFKGGIYIASTVRDSTEVFDALVDKTQAGIVDRHGGCEHLRPFVGKGTKLLENELAWITDETVHESLPLRETQYRQFVRFVGPYVSHWYADHSTANPCCPLPDDVIVVHGNKFASNKDEYVQHGSHLFPK